MNRRIVVSENNNMKDSVERMMDVQSSICLNSTRENFPNVTDLIKKWDEDTIGPTELLKQNVISLNDLSRGEFYFDFKVKNQEQKENVKDALMRILDSHVITEPHKDDLILTIDELLMNAIYTAPLEAGIELEAANKEAKLQLLCYDKKLFIFCEDEYGSFKSQKAISRLFQLYSNDGEAPPRRDTHGSGLGLKVILSNTTDLFFFCLPKQSTLVMGIFPLAISNIARSKIGKNLIMLENN